MSQGRFLFSEEFRERILDGTAAEANGGPIRTRKKKPSYVAFDGIRIETKMGLTIVSILWKDLVLGSIESPQMGPRDTLTIQGEAIEGRSPFKVTS